MLNALQNPCKSRAKQEGKASGLSNQMQAINILLIKEPFDLENANEYIFGQATAKKISRLFLTTCLNNLH